MLFYLTFVASFFGGDFSSLCLSPFRLFSFEFSEVAYFRTERKFPYLQSFFRYFRKFFSGFLRVRNLRSREFLAIDYANLVKKRINGSFLYVIQHFFKFFLLLICRVTEKVLTLHRKTKGTLILSFAP